jgi:3-hydroxyacyl-[acyl-carrier-protein] dehydratase
LDMEVTLKRVIRNMAQYLCVARVDGKEVASAEVLCAEGRS